MVSQSQGLGVLFKAADMPEKKASSFVRQFSIAALRSALELGLNAVIFKYRIKIITRLRSGSEGG